jgi:hypothetical protein
VMDRYVDRFRCVLQAALQWRCWSVWFYCSVLCRTLICFLGIQIYFDYYSIIVKWVYLRFCFVSIIIILYKYNKYISIIIILLRLLIKLFI